MRKRAQWCQVLRSIPANGAPTIQYRKILYSQLFGTVYAITDEIHQLFIPGRSGEIRDVCIDSLGVLTGIIFMLMIIKIYIKIKKVKSNEKQIVSNE